MVAEAGFVGVGFVDGCWWVDDCVCFFGFSNMQFLFDNTVPVFGTIKNLLGLVAEIGRAHV